MSPRISQIELIEIQAEDLNEILRKTIVKKEEYIETQDWFEIKNQIDV